MKRVLALLLAFALVLGMAACSSGPKPEDTVKKFFEAMKTFDVETMQSCVEGEYDATEMLTEEEEDMTGLIDYLKENAKTLTYKISSSEVKEDKAKVGVSVEYTDTSEVIGDAFATYIMALFSMMFSEDATEEDLEKAFTEGLANAIETKETTRATEDLSLDLILKDGVWKLTDVPEETANVMLGNLMHAMDGLDDLFGSDDIGWDTGVEPVDYPIANEVVLDNDEVRMTVVSGGTDEWGEIVFKVLCENKSAEKSYVFSIDDVNVNGWRAGSSLYEEVPAGKSSNAEFTIFSDTLKEVGIESPDKVECLVRIYNEDDWWNDILLVDDSFTIYPTGLSESEITVPDRPTQTGEVVLEDNDIFTMVVLGEADLSWTYGLKAYVKNNSDRTIDISWEDVSVNGFMCEPYWGTSLTPGQQAMTEITFDSEDFENNGIETVEEIEFTLQAQDNTTWDVIYSQNGTYTPQ